MAVATETRTDTQIQSDVLVELKWDARVMPNEIGVLVKDGVVTLTGWVDSYTKKWAAEDATHRVRGVKAVANNIEVRLPSSSERTDADIAAAAVRALDWDAFVPIDKIDVTVSKGWVTLKGEVEWQYQKQDADRVIRRLSGVKGVTNLITIKPHLTASELKTKIEQALVRSRKPTRDASRSTSMGAKWSSRGQCAPGRREKRRRDRRGRRLGSRRSTTESRSAIERPDNANLEMGWFVSNQWNELLCERR